MTNLLAINQTLKAALIFTLVLRACSILAMEPNSEHTYKLGDSKPPSATLADAAMLIGNWQGEAFGNKFEEVFNPPSGGSMMGMFKVYDDVDGVDFYEIMSIVEDNGSLSFKVKHFTKDFIAWESKEDFVNFKLVGVEENALHFSGISFYKINENTMHAYIVLNTKNGRREEKLVYRRVID